VVDYVFRTDDPRDRIFVTCYPASLKAVRINVADQLTELFQVFLSGARLVVGFDDLVKLWNVHKLRLSVEFSIIDKAALSGKQTLDMAQYKLHRRQAAVG
jgi:hypothetical protein